MIPSVQFEDLTILTFSYLEILSRVTAKLRCLDSSNMLSGDGEWKDKCTTELEFQFMDLFTSNELNIVCN